MNMFFSLLVFQSFSLSELSLGGNWVDFLILLILAYFVSEAWRIGFWVILAGFLGFLLSLLIGLWGYSYVADILRSNFSLPLSSKLKSDVTGSRIGGTLVRETSGLEAKINEIFGGLVEDSLTYLTVRPGSTTIVPLETETQELVVDEAAETELFRLVNEERRKRGVDELSLRSEVVPVARAHAKDMWERQYFGHVSRDGEDVGVRLDKAGVSYTLAGGNLAVAPTLQTAPNGLMNSEGHRHNILDPEFKRLGIGVIDNGIYGKIFVQVFTD